MPDDKKQVVGWMIALDTTAVCRRCAADENEARTVWGATEDARDLLVVGPVHRLLARRHNLRCLKCGRHLTE